jgi:hypothetical protein
MPVSGTVKSKGLKYFKDIPVPEGASEIFTINRKLASACTDRI